MVFAGGILDFGNAWMTLNSHDTSLYKEAWHEINETYPNLWFLALDDSVHCFHSNFPVKAIPIATL